MAFREFTGELDEAAPSGPVREFTGELDAEPPMQAEQSAQLPEPSMGAVALNAIPKGVANLANTPHTLNGLVIRGLASLPGLDKLPEVKNFLQGIADHPEFNRNRPMEFMQKIGAVNPENEPQTGPQRVIDQAIQAAIGAAAVPGGATLNLAKQAVVPAGGALNAAKSAAMGAASGTAAQMTREATGSDLLASAVGAAVPLAVSAPSLVRAVKPTPNSPLNNKTRMQTLEEAQQLGLRVQPTSVKPTAKNQMLESVAGPGKLNIALTLENQAAATAASKQALGLPKTAELTTDTLKELREAASKPYRDIAALSPKAADALEKLKQARYEANEYFRYYFKSGDPAAGKTAREWKAKASNYENIIDQEAKKIVDIYGVKHGGASPRFGNRPQLETRALTTGQEVGPSGGTLNLEKVGQTTAGDPYLLDRLRDARKLIARSYNVETALNRGDGHVSLEVLGKMYQEKMPLSGELEVLGKFANAFETVSRRGSAVGTVASGTDAASAATLATMGSSSGAGGLLSGGLPLARGPARRKLLSDDIQKYLSKDKPRTPAHIPLGRAAMTGKTVLDNAEGSE